MTFKTVKSFRYNEEVAKVGFDWFLLSTVGDIVGASKLNEKVINQLLRRKSKCPDISIHFAHKSITLKVLSYDGDTEMVESVYLNDLVADDVGYGELRERIRNTVAKCVIFWRKSLPKELKNDFKRNPPKTNRITEPETSELDSSGYAG